MNPIIRFEVLYHCRQAYTPLFFLLLIFQGVWYMIGVNDLFANNSVHLNAPAIIYRNLAVMGIILFAITAIISAGGLARDLETRAANVIYPGVVHEKQYFLGKYVGVLLVNFAVVLGYPIGILLFPFFGAGSPDQLGPIPFGQMVQGLLLLMVPNLIFLVTFAVFLVVMFRRAAAAYLGILVVCILFLLSTSTRKDSLYSLVIELFDPFGYCSVESITETMGVRELNNAYLPLTPTFLLNRLIWGAFSLILLGVAFLKFNFKEFVARFVKKNSRNETTTASVSQRVFQVFPTLEFGHAANLIKSVRLAAADLKTLAASPMFLAITATLFLMFMGYNFFWTSAYYLTTSHLPLTSTMTYARIPMMVVIGLMLLLLSGELLFKDRTSGVWQIVDAMPTPSWVFVLSRLLVMAGVAFLLMSLIFMAGVLSQWIMGTTDIDWNLYIRDLYGSRFGWLTCLHLICMAFFCGALFGNRLKGHIVSIALFLFIAMSVDFKLIEQLRFAFSFVPGVFGPEKYNYSEMNGYGVLDAGLGWYAGAWTALAVLFLFSPCCCGTGAATGLSKSGCALCDGPCAPPADGLWRRWVSVACCCSVTSSMVSMII
jgi:ABC-type transport system involved in multi-copper enzyme maturation permease subunit